MYTAHCGVGQMVNQIHFGGTPHLSVDTGLRDLMGMLRSSFTPFGAGSTRWGRSRTVDADRLALLAELDSTV